MKSFFARLEGCTLQSRVMNFTQAKTGAPWTKHHADCYMTLVQLLITRE